MRIRPRQRGIQHPTARAADSRPYGVTVGSHSIPNDRMARCVGPYNRKNRGSTSIRTTPVSVSCKRNTENEKLIPRSLRTEHYFLSTARCASLKSHTSG